MHYDDATLILFNEARVRVAVKISFKLLKLITYNLAHPMASPDHRKFVLGPGLIISLLAVAGIPV